MDRVFSPVRIIQSSGLDPIRIFFISLISKRTVSPLDRTGTRIGHSDFLSVHIIGERGSYVTRRCNRFGLTIGTQCILYISRHIWNPNHSTDCIERLWNRYSLFGLGNGILPVIIHIGTSRSIIGTDKPIMKVIRHLIPRRGTLRTKRQRFLFEQTVLIIHFIGKEIVSVKTLRSFADFPA